MLFIETLILGKDMYVGTIVQIIHVEPRISSEHFSASCRYSSSKPLILAASYTSALQTIALFGMRMDRIAAMVGALTFLIM
jgi:hypothetical protein